MKDYLMVIGIVLLVVIVIGSLIFVIGNDTEGVRETREQSFFECIEKVNEVEWCYERFIK